MKKLSVLLIYSVLCITSCTKKYYDRGIISFHNYSYPKPLYIDTANISLLTNIVFDANSCDTFFLRRFNKTDELEVAKRRYEKNYEPEVRSEHAWQVDINSLYYGKYFLYGKLDLQSDVISLVLFEYSEDDLFHKTCKYLWLINIADSNLNSIVLLDDFRSGFNADVGNCVSITTLRNKIFTKTKTCFPRYSFKNWKTKTTAQFRVNEEGYIEFIKPIRQTK